MYIVGLVQNQSEMSHYGYADARPILASSSFGYEVQLYTGQNISFLIEDLLSKAIDALIIASHALNDKTIEAELSNKRFKNALESFLQNGGGCLVLHQLRFGERARDKELTDGRLMFLPQDIDAVLAMARPRTDKGIESATVGRIAFPDGSKDNFLLHYPNELDREQIERRCLQEGGLQGLYWHYWDNVDSSKWDVIMEDDEPSYEKPRSLIIAAKEALKYRMVLSSLTLDWQRQNEVLENILKYVVEGHQYMALLTTNQRPTIGLSYLMERLSSKKFSYNSYIIPQSAEKLENAVERGIHSIIVATKESYSLINRDLKEKINVAVRNGKLKLLIVGQADFTVYGRERDTLKQLLEIELLVQYELANGFVDNSFWNTVESLQVLQRLPESTLQFNADTLEKVINDVDMHDMEGSYDGVFGASCALLWLRAVVLGPNDEQTKRTGEWIRNRIDQYEWRERILALLTMLQSGFSAAIGKRDEDIVSLNDILKRIDYENQSEINAIMYLQAANYVEHKDAIKYLALFLCEDKNQKNGIWVDISTTSTAILALLEARTKLVGDNSVVDRIDNSLFAAVIALQKSRMRIASKQVYLWDSKASTNLKCLEALLNFERTIELPVTELIDSLQTYTRNSSEIESSGKSLNVLFETQKSLGELRKENERIRSMERKAQECILRLKALKKIILTLSIAGAILSYTIIQLFLYCLSKESVLLGEYFLLQLPQHIAFLGVVVAIVFGVLALMHNKEKRE